MAASLDVAPLAPPRYALIVAVLSADERDRFLKLYQRSGLEAQSLLALGRRPEDLEHTRRACPGFAEDVDLAYQLRCEAIEEEINRRATLGYEEPVFYRGEECGTVRKFSDPLLLALARRHIPEYRESVRVDQRHQVSGSVELGLEALRALPPAAQEKLREVVVEAEARRLPEPSNATPEGQPTA